MSATPARTQKAPTRRILPPIYLLVCLIAILVIHWLLPLAIIIPKPYGYVGIMAIISGIAMPLWVNWRFSQAQTTIKPFQESSALVTDGLFRYCRNPAYVGMVLGLVGIVVILGSLAPWFFVVLFTIAIDRKFVLHEERALRERFGATYDEYCRKVRRWI